MATCALSLPGAVASAPRLGASPWYSRALRPLFLAVARPAFHSFFAQCLAHAGCPAACPAPACSVLRAPRRGLSRGSSQSAYFSPRRGCRPPAWPIARGSSCPTGACAEGGSGVGSPPGSGTYSRVAVCPCLGVIPVLPTWCHSWLPSLVSLGTLRDACRENERRPMLTVASCQRVFSLRIAAARLQAFPARPTRAWASGPPPVQGQMAV